MHDNSSAALGWASRWGEVGKMRIIVTLDGRKRPRVLLGV